MNLIISHHEKKEQSADGGKSVDMMVDIRGKKWE